MNLFTPNLQFTLNAASITGPLDALYYDVSNFSDTATNITADGAFAEGLTANGNTMGYVRGGHFNQDGTIWMVWHSASGANQQSGTPSDNDHRLNRYDLSTPWDVTTRTFVSNSDPVPAYKSPTTPTLGGMHGCAFNQSGTQFATWHADNGDLEIYELNTAWDPTSLNTTKLGTLGVYTVGSTTSNYGGVSTGVTNDGKTYLIGSRSYHGSGTMLSLKTHILENDLFVSGVHGTANVTYMGSTPYSAGGTGAVFDDMIQGGSAFWNADGTKLFVMPQTWQYIELSGGGLGDANNASWGVFSASTPYDPSSLSADFTRDGSTNYAEEDDIYLRYISNQTSARRACQLQVIQYGEKIVKYEYAGSTFSIFDTGETRR